MAQLATHARAPTRRPSCCFAAACLASPASLALSLSLAAHCPHLSAPFFFFPFFFLSFPFFTAGAFLSPVTTDGKPSAPSPAYGKRPIHRFPSYFPHRLAYITPSRPRLLSPSSAHYPELPPPVRTPLPSANADAKATRSTAGPPAPVGTPHFAFWRCFARLHPHPHDFSLSSSRPPLTSRLELVPNAENAPIRLTVSSRPSLYLPFPVSRRGAPFR